MLSTKHSHMLAGSSFSTILRLLKENRFDVEPRHLPRLADALLKVGLSTPLRFLDKNRFEDRILSTEIPKPPVFVIGHWRSGTTFLHNLMAEDGNLEYPTTFHTLMPWSFMGGDLFLRPHLEDALPPTRPMDDIPMHLDFPYEEEFGMANLTHRSFCHAWIFPRRMMECFERHVVFDGVGGDEIEEWKKTYLYFLKKVTLKTGGRKRLVLKNPANTARIRHLVDLFPDARFVFIHRNPLEVYFSTLRLHERVVSSIGMQGIGRDEIERNTLEIFSRMMDRYLGDRGIVPEGRLVEVRYEDLLADPLSELERIYGAVGLPGFAFSSEAFADYVASQAGYRPSEYEIDGDTERKVRAAWAVAFEEWGR